jgi:hypothetical protein
MLILKFVMDMVQSLGLTLKFEVIICGSFMLEVKV